MEDQLITFETAKLAKEKGFDIHTLDYYFEDGEFRRNELTGTNGYYGEEYSFSYEEFLENWNDKFVTKKNGDRCLGCDKSKNYFETYSAPTQSLLQRWLRKKHNIHICNNLHYMVNGGIAGYLVDISSPYDLFKSILVEGQSYEQALEKGLQEALKLINNEKTY